MVGPEGVSLGIRNEVITIKRYTIMKIEIINHQTGNQEIEVSRGIYFYDSKGNQYRLFENKFGELEIQSTDGALVLRPVVSNEIIIKTES